MSDRWYRLAQAGEPLTQGDLIFRCPILTWKSIPVETDLILGAEALSQLIDPFEDDVVVMTQACDLEHGKVSHVVLCPHTTLTSFKRLWEEDQRRHGQNPTAKSWQKLCEDIRDGYLWNMSMLNAENVDGLEVEHRVVDFRDIFTVPREMLESLLSHRNEPRPPIGSIFPRRSPDSSCALDCRRTCRPPGSLPDSFLPSTRSARQVQAAASRFLNRLPR